MDKEPKIKSIRLLLQEHAKLAMEQINKQEPATYEKARAQFLRLEMQGFKKNTRQQ